MTFIACIPSSSSRTVYRSIRAATALPRRLASTSSAATSLPDPTTLPPDPALAPSSTASAGPASTSLPSSSSSPSSSTSADPSKPTHYLVTLRRSTIGLPDVYIKTLHSLGLSGRNRQSVLHPFSAETGGKILRVKEIVSVQNVTKERGKVLMQRRQPEGPGVQVTGRAFGGSKMA